MYAYAKKTSKKDKSNLVNVKALQKKQPSTKVTHSVSPTQTSLQSTLQSTFNAEPSLVTQLKQGDSQWAKAIQRRPNSETTSPVQKKANKTGLPDSLKSGVENLSGYSMDDVKVHYNSDKPAQIQAHAYTQGTDIHVASGQEKHLAHEAWHVVQQKQGRVKPTMQMKGGVNVNDDVGLEKEADVMGAKGLQNDSTFQDISLETLQTTKNQADIPIQMVKESEFIEDPDEFMKNNVVLFDYKEGFFKKYTTTIATIDGTIADKNLKSNVVNLMVANKDNMNFTLEDSGIKEKGGRPIYYTTPAIGLLGDSQIKNLFKNGDIFLDNADSLVETLKLEETSKKPPTYIRANYAPYFIGTPESFDTDVGRTVVDPKVTDFVFTDAMNGCAYAITEVKGDETKFEAWHFQSESSNWSEASEFRATKGIRDWFGVNDYYIAEEGEKNLAATNIIWQKGEGEWKILSQKNVVPLNLDDETVFEESTSHDLNVKKKMSKRRLKETHEKLLTGARKSIPVKDIKKVNEALEKLTIGTNLRDESVAKIHKDNKTMEKSEATEINKISKNIQEKEQLQEKKVERPLFKTLKGFEDKLEKIKNTGMHLYTYNRSKTKALKSEFIKESNSLFDKIKELVENATQVVITADENILNEAIIQFLLDIQFYYDVYESYGSYNDIKKIIDPIKRINNKKEGVTSRKEKFKQEMDTLYPG